MVFSFSFSFIASCLYFNYTYHEFYFLSDFFFFIFNQIEFRLFFLNLYFIFFFGSIQRHSNSSSFVTNFSNEIKHFHRSWFISFLFTLPCRNFRIYANFLIIIICFKTNLFSLPVEYNNHHKIYLKLFFPVFPVRNKKIFPNFLLFQYILYVYVHK